MSSLDSLCLVIIAVCNRSETMRVFFYEGYALYFCHVFFLLEFSPVNIWVLFLTLTFVMIFSILLLKQASFSLDGLVGEPVSCLDIGLYVLSILIIITP